MPACSRPQPQDLHDPTSPAYKRARKRHFKTFKNRPEGVEADWTPFRAAEKRFKARFPPPDLSDVLDLAAEDANRDIEVEGGWWRGCANAVEVREVELKDGWRKGYVLADTPGLVLLSHFISEEDQRELVRWALRDHARPPNITNLDTHYTLPEEGLWNAHITSDRVICPLATSPAQAVSEPSGPRTLIANASASPSELPALLSALKPPPAPSLTVPPLPASALMTKLRWANIGWFYHWGTKQYDFARGKEAIDPRIQAVCKEAVRSVPWDSVFHNGGNSDDDGGKMNDDEWGEEGPDWARWEGTYGPEPDAGIVNFYQLKDTLMAHVDRSEICATSPLVSISLGNAAVFLIGGHTRDVPPTPILLRSGDVLIMSGPACRRAYHGVPRILENTLPPHLQEREGGEDAEDAEWAPFARYLSTARINVNVRQVFPTWFVPPVRVT